VSGQRNTVVAIGIASLSAALASGWIASRPTTAVSDVRRAAVRAPAEEKATGEKPAEDTPAAATPTTTVAANDKAPDTPKPLTAQRPQELRDLLIATGPEGFVELSSDAGPAGEFDLESFVQHSENPELDRAALTENRFRRGYVRSWQRLFSDGPRRIVASVFEFEDVHHAVVYLIHKRDQAIAEDGGERFPVESGVGVRFVHRVDGTDVHGYTIAFHQDNLVYYLGALYPSEQPADEIRALETRQRELLARSADDT
jgi:hypothetical protein